VAPLLAGGVGGYGDRGYAAATAYRSLEDDREVQVDTILQVGRKTFLRRDGKWVDSTLSADQEKKAKKVQRFSKNYFDLVKRLGKDSARYLAIDGKVTIVLDGQAYEY
jgi:hypothetical protein